jgi:hypothetical protein
MEANGVTPIPADRQLTPLTEVMIHTTDKQDRFKLGKVLAG